jgi:predicted ATP-binding protein involved in virulence
VSVSPSSKDPRAQVPVWAQALPLSTLQSMLFLGAWDPALQHPDDIRVLSRLGSTPAELTMLGEAGQAAGALRYERRRLHPVGESGQSWRFTDAKATWRQLAWTLDDAACDRFAAACLVAYAGECSPTLRRGLALSLALLGNSDGRIAVSPKPSQRAAAIIERILPARLPAWGELGDLLALFAEAAPESFLTCAEQAVMQAGSPPGDAQTQATQEIQRAAEAIARALALLALDVLLLSRVTRLLGRLAILCPPPRPNVHSGHPLQILVAIFRLDWPKTNAGIEERLAALEELRQDSPKAAWELFLRLLAEGGEMALHVPRSVVMQISVPSRTRGVSSAALYGQQQTLLHWAIELAGNDGLRWAALLPLEAHLFADLFIGLLRHLQTKKLADVSHRTTLWAALRSSLNRFRPESVASAGESASQPASDRELRQQQIDALTRALYDALTPTDFVAAHAWLFDAPASLPAPYSSVQERYKQWEQTQAQFVAELGQREDRWERLAELVAQVKDEQRLAVQLARSRCADELEQAFERLHGLSPRLSLSFLGQRLRQRDFGEIARWLRRLSQSPESVEAAHLAQHLWLGTPERELQLWDLLDELGEPIRREYWQTIPVLSAASPRPATATARFIDRLIDLGRWDDARTAAIVLQEPATTRQRLDLLSRARKAVGKSNAALWVELWNEVEPHSPEETQLARQGEAAWLDLLSATHYRLRFIPRWLEEEPRAFVEIVKEHTIGVLCHLWGGWPGDKQSGSEAQRFLYRWAQDVLSHGLAVGIRQDVGAWLAPILSRSRGKDGLWPAEALRRLLEEESARGESALADGLRRSGRDDPFPQARFLDEWIQRSSDVAADCEQSAQKLADDFPATAAICKELAARYRETAADWQERNQMREPQNMDVGPLFPLTELQIENFRGIKQAVFRPLHPRLNILFGRNASGKSSVLDALRIGLAQLVPKLTPDIGEKIGDLPRLVEEDRHRSQEWPKGAPQVRITVSGQRHEEEPLTWLVERNYGRGAEAQDRETAVLTPYFDALNARLGQGDAAAPLPVFAFYGVQRIPNAKAEQPETPKLGQRIRADGLRDALKGSSGFEASVDWFWREQFAEGEERRERPKYESPALRAIRQAIGTTLQTPEGVGIKNPRIDKEMTFVVDFVRPGKGDLRLKLGQLSDGFRTLLMLVIDLVRRIAECYPPLEGETDPAERWRQIPAVVLIDEVDAHLHPSWQKTVLHNLLNAFPQAQFFVTTHAPLVLAAEQEAAIWLLEDGKETKVGQTYGKTPDVILEDYLDIELRPDELQAKLDAIRDALQRSEFDSAAASLAELEAEPKLDPELPDLVTLRTRLHLLRDRAARGATKQPA